MRRRENIIKQVSAVTTRTKHLAAGRSAEGRLQGKNDHEFDQFK